jgi:peptide/nickel transport system substrate-binding protein
MITMTGKYLCLLVIISVITACGKIQNKAIEAGPSIALPVLSDANLDGKLILNVGAEPSTFNPLLYTDSASGEIIDYIFNGLIKINESLEFEPDLAEKWTISEDGLTYRFYLRRDVQWHDGQPFSVDDVAFTIDRLLDKKTNTVRRSNYVINGKPIAYKVINDYQINFILPEPFAPFLSNISTGIIPKHRLENQDINSSDFNKNPIGTGPYVFDNYRRGTHIKLIRNDKFYRGKPRIKEVYFKIIPDQNAGLLAFKAGELDLSSIPPKDYHKLKEANDFNVFSWESLSYTYLGFNLDHPLLSQKPIREAIALAIDKQILVDVIFKGLAKPAHIPMSPVSWAYSDQFKTYDYLPTKASKILDDNGWILDQKKLVRQKGEQELAFNILVNQGNKEREKAAVIIQDALKKVGIKVDITIMEWSSLLKKITGETKEFDSLIIGWSLGIDPDGYNIWHSSQYPKGFNFVHYQNKLVDKLLVDARRETNQDERKLLYEKIFNNITKDLPYVFLWYPQSLVAAQRYVGGISERPGPTGLFVELENVFVTR